MRGEDLEQGKKTRLSDGSPPHARGRHRLNIGDGAVLRITPACAGKTQVQQGSRREGSDHPRMRGEDRGSRRRRFGGRGSPPHARGRQVDGFEKRIRDGITPACAGKTAQSRFDVFQRQDHPRMRGEDADPKYPFPVILGSPPHARGRLVSTSANDTDFGITPACAGKTSHFQGRAHV